ncbi:hypothetical protein L3X38_037142 [Prunus dulcis]|uniref:Uncharacterized protein n=1 Tax=Prunus dulcis TaxID=3755 RepID=A0AAD4V2S6_PRUDU|nr:hypothetical protein L3X38_037142 [Prunus dulcis]
MSNLQRRLCRNFGRKSRSLVSGPSIGVLSGIPQDSSRVSGNSGRVLSILIIYGAGKIGEVLVRMMVAEFVGRRSKFFGLEYWKYLPVRHVLDVKHIEKNVCDSIIGTLLEIPGKNKDGIAA